LYRKRGLAVCGGFSLCDLFALDEKCIDRDIKHNIVNNINLKLDKNIDNSIINNDRIIIKK
jgi:hypothetical protein